MDEFLINDTKEQLLRLFGKIKNILLSQDSYSTKIEIENIDLYLHLVSKSITRTYNRISHIYAFISEKEMIKANKMYPLCYLSKEAEMKLTSIYCQANWLIEGFTKAISEETKILELEPHEIED